MRPRPNNFGASGERPNNFATHPTLALTITPKAAGKLARHHASGGKPYESLTVGESLLVGRDVAMKLSGSNRPHRKQYSIEFQAWKSKCGFVRVWQAGRLRKKLGIWATNQY